MNRRKQAQFHTKSELLAIPYGLLSAAKHLQLIFRQKFARIVFSKTFRLIHSRELSHELPVTEGLPYSNAEVIDILLRNLSSNATLTVLMINGLSTVYYSTCMVQETGIEIYLSAKRFTIWKTTRFKKIFVPKLLTKVWRRGFVTEFHLCGNV